MCIFSMYNVVYNSYEFGIVGTVLSMVDDIVGSITMERGRGRTKQVVLTTMEVLGCDGMALLDVLESEEICFGNFMLDLQYDWESSWYQCTIALHLQVPPIGSL